MYYIQGFTEHEARFRTERQQRGGLAEFQLRKRVFDSYMEASGTVISTVAFGGPISQLKFIGNIRKFRMGKFVETFGGYALPGSSISMIGLGFALDKIMQSPRQDTPTSTPGVQVPKTRGGTKSSRAPPGAQTLKPFWSNGKPKCRKGYRYDFKRKMCVKKS